MNLSKRLGLVIDQERCIGCETCSIACTIENNPATGPWIRVQTVGGEQKDTPSGQYPDLKMDFLPQLCMHCDHPPCVKVCLTEALWKREDGLVLLEQEKCNGCQECLGACPYGVIAYSTETGVVEKCNLCRHRIDEGLEPFCVICCEGKAIHFGNLGNPASEVARLVATRVTFTVMPEADTGPAVFYCPPRERRSL